MPIYSEALTEGYALAGLIVSAENLACEAVQDGIPEASQSEDSTASSLDGRIAGYNAI